MVITQRRRTRGFLLSTFTLFFVSQEVFEAIVDDDLGVVFFRAAEPGIGSDTGEASVRHRWYGPQRERSWVEHTKFSVAGRSYFTNSAGRSTCDVRHATSRSLRSPTFARIRHFFYLPPLGLLGTRFIDKIWHASTQNSAVSNLEYCMLAPLTSTTRQNPRSPTQYAYFLRITLSSSSRPKMHR